MTEIASRFEEGPWKDRIKRIIGIGALALSGYSGGIVATLVFPAEVETEYYRAEIETLPLPGEGARINSFTNAGDIELHFDSLIPPPGFEVSAQLKGDAIDAFSDTNISLNQFVPTDTELHTVEVDALRHTGLTFVGGVALGELVVGLPYLAAASSPILRRKLITATTMLGVGVGVVGATAGNMYHTYNPDHFTSYTTTETLGRLESNIGMLSDIEDRFTKAAPYIKNFLLLSEALKQEFVPPELDQPAAARLLLISDQHGVNQFSLMKEIIVDERIDAVIDMGDMLNYGSKTEGELAGIYESIGNLPVPYILVDGNHDALSATDQAHLDHLRQLPNVILLQYDGEYTVTSINGVTIAGYNDPRYSTDEGTNTADKQVPALEAFRRTFADEEQPHIVVAHEPAVTEIDKADLTINGHMHKTTLDENHIGVGSFTGAGIVSHFRQGVDSNGNGQPSAFDILSFGEDCTPTSLQRVIFNGALQGRPVYEEVSTINGERFGIEPREDITCSADQGIHTTTIKEVEETEASAPTPVPTPSLEAATQN